MTGNGNGPQTPGEIAKVVWGWVSTHVVIDVIAVVVVFGLIVFSQANSADKEAAPLETSLSAQMNTTMGQLGTTITIIKQDSGLANVQADKLDSVLTDVVKGKFGNGNGTDPSTVTNPIVPGQRGAFINALHEAYPQIGRLVYDKVIRAVEANWQKFQNEQVELQDRLATYESWLSGGIWNEFIRQTVAGFPSDDLRIDVGDVHLKGQEARDFMHVIVQPEQSVAVYTSKHHTYNPDTIIQGQEQGQNQAPTPAQPPVQAQDQGKSGKGKHKKK
jgi:hypothetical protein